MKKENFVCKICSVNFTTMITFKKHLFSPEHREQYAKIYPNDVFKRNRKSYTPWIFIKETDYQEHFSAPILGLSQMTLCFFSEDTDRSAFYLCHVCEQMFPGKNVVPHISHVNHYSNYFAYTDPNALSFSSVLSENDMHSWMDNIKQEHEKTGMGELQVLHMPERLFRECPKGNYRQVMFFLHQIKSLSEIFKKRKPERMWIQRYKDDSNRKHPLLGLQHIVECICTPHDHFRHYLCTLCGFHVSSSFIIRHLLSFDHIYTYLSIWHPSTLKAKESYRKDSSDACTLTDLAKQSEELDGLNEIQQVRLETSQMLSVLNVHFKAALSKIELIANKGSLIPTVKPGKNLGPTGSGKTPTDVKQDSMSEHVTSGNNLIQNIVEENEESTAEHCATPAAPSYSFHCQNCSENFETNTLYYNHLSKPKHQENFEKNFGAVVDKQTGGCKPHLHSYKYFTEHDVLFVGVSLVVTILSHQLSDEPVHLCFACETIFLRQDLKRHMNSEKHIVQSLMYQNPWKLPFGWKKRPEYASLKLQACVEEEEKGPNKNIRILDVPPCLFPHEAPLTYSKVMEKLGQYHNLLMNGVPQRETSSKLQDNDRFPILGRNFLVKYGQTISGWKFLCLLCQRSLSSDDYTGHVFSWEHVVAFLENFHPGSLDLNGTNEEILLDLAKQAAQIHPVSDAQEIEFDSSQHRSDLMNYKTRHQESQEENICSMKSLLIDESLRELRLLSAEKTRDGKEPFMPSITPKMKLFPKRRTQEKNVDTNESNAVTKTQSVYGNAGEKLVDGFQSADQESHVQRIEPMEIGLQEVNNLPTEKQSKEEKDPINPSEPSQLEEIKSAITSSCKSVTNTASKRERSQSDMDTSDSEFENMEPKRVCLSKPDEEKATPNLQNVDKAKLCTSNDPVDNSAPCYGRELQSFIQRKNRSPLIGLSVIYECVFNDRSPIYLCECCHLKFKEQHITKHLTEPIHYFHYLQMVGEDLPSQGAPWKIQMNKLAMYWERRNGYEQTRVVKLTPGDYDELDCSNYYTAFKIVGMYLTKMVNKNIRVHALPENFAKTVATKRQETSQQDMHMETDSEPVAASSKTEPPSKNEITSKSQDANLTRTPDSEQHAVHAMAADSVPQCLPSTVTITPTTPAISSSSLVNNGKSSAKTKDGAESINIVEEASFKMENSTCTGTLESAEPTTKAVIPEVESKTVSTHENTSDQIPYATPASGTTTNTPKPTAEVVGKFMTAKSATTNIPTHAMTNLEATNTPASTCNSDIVTPDTRKTTSTMLAFKVPDCIPTSRATVSNPTKRAPNPHDKLVLPDAVPKRKAASAIGGEPVLKVAMLDNDNLPAKKGTTESLSSQTKFLSAAPATATSKTFNIHAKSKGTQLKLNVKAASHVKNDDPVLKSGALTPTTPNYGVPISIAETSQVSQIPVVGLDQLVKVKCKEKRLVFCFACVTTLESTSHLTNTTHQINCVKRKFPWWSAKPGEEELSKMIALLRDDEKASKVESKKIEVSFEIYRELKALPADQAIEKVKGMNKRKSSKKPGQRRPSASTSEVSNSLCDISTSPNFSVSPCGITSPDLGKENGLTNPPVKSSAQPIKELPVSPSPLVQKPTSKVAPRIIQGSTTDDPSTLFRILAVKNTSVIGLCLVWECRVVPPKHPTFYLCESCSLTISVNEICDHMESTGHHLNYLMRQYPRFMYWTEEELLPQMSIEFIDYIADMVKCQEESMDAQTVLLSEECFQLVRTAPFLEALNVVQRIKQEKKTTTLPLIVTPQHEVEPRGQQRTQPTLDTSNTLTDFPNQTEISEMVGEITDSDHTQHEDPLSGNIARGNAESCPCPTDTNCTTTPQITEPLDPQNSPKNFPKQLDEPAYSASDQTLAVSPKDENHEHCEPETKALLSDEMAVVSPLDTTETTTSVTLQDTYTDIKPEADIQLGTPSIQETSTLSPNRLEDVITKGIKEGQMTEECSPHGHSDTSGQSTSVMGSSMADHNANETPPLDSDAEDKAALDQHYCLLLIDLLKQAKSNMQRSTSSSNPTSELWTHKSPESNEEQCEAPQHTRLDVGQPPKTDTDTAAKVDNILTENKTGQSVELLRKNFTSGTFVSNKNPEKTTCDNMTAVSSDSLNETTISDLITQQPQGQLVQSKDDEPTEESKVLKVQQKEIKMKEIKMKSSVPGSQVSVQTSPLKIHVTQTESQYNSSVHSEVQQPQCQVSQQKHELQLKSYTQEASSKCPQHTSPSLTKTVQADSEASQLQTQETEVKLLQQTQNQVSLLQTLLAHSPSTTQQGQSQKEQEQLNIVKVNLRNQQSQQQTQSQVLRLDLQTQLTPTQHVTQLTQGQTGQVSIDALITQRPQNKMHFRRETDYRQNLCFINTRDHVRQEPPLSSAATPSATSSSMVVTGEYGQFVQTANLANTDYSNTHALYGVPHGSVHPSHFYQRLQTQQHYTSVQPFLQNVQHPEVSALFNPTSQLQPFPQYYSAWSNGTVGGPSNVAYSNAVAVSTVSNPSYTYTYTTEQEDNRLIMQNLLYSPSFTPTQTNSQFFPPRQ